MHGPRHARRTRARGLHSVHAGILHIVVLGRKFSSDAIDFQPGSKGWISTISNLSKLINHSVGKELTSFASHLDHISTLNLPRCFYSKCCQCGRLLKWHSCIHYTVGGSAFPLRSSLSLSFPSPLADQRCVRPRVRRGLSSFVGPSSICAQRRRGDGEGANVQSLYSSDSFPPQTEITESTQMSSRVVEMLLY